MRRLPGPGCQQRTNHWCVYLPALTSPWARHFPKLTCYGIYDSACRTLSTAEKLAAGLPHATALALDVKSPDLDTYVASHDVVISLVPFIYHADVIRSAIKGKTQVVTTSYVSPAMRELEPAAKEAGITILNEVGVDPGIDHLYAVKVIEEVHAKGGQILEFYSYCGGLVAPEAVDNPLKFKVLSVSPMVLIYRVL